MVYFVQVGCIQDLEELRIATNFICIACQFSELLCPWKTLLNQKDRNCIRVAMEYETWLDSSPTSVLSFHFEICAKQYVPLPVVRQTYSIIFPFSGPVSAFLLPAICWMIAHSIFIVLASYFTIGWTENQETTYTLEMCDFASCIHHVLFDLPLNLHYWLKYSVYNLLHVFDLVFDLHFCLFLLISYITCEQWLVGGRHHLLYTHFSLRFG